MIKQINEITVIIPGSPAGSFPPVEYADIDGIVAIGGDLNSDRLVEAYRRGIFPWYSKGEPIIWWSPDPRIVLFPEEIKISKSMRKWLKKTDIKVTADKSFEKVIRSCAKSAPGRESTWITEEMILAYVNLHKLGHAHSIEAWWNNELVGGLYGVYTNKCFCGESMFSKISNASKACLIKLTEGILNLPIKLIDCQIHSNHLESLGAREISRNEFICSLKN